MRAECLDWLLILNRRHLDRVLRVYVEHYNAQSARTGHSPCSRRTPTQRHHASTRGEIRRRDRLGGLIHEYYRAAA